MSSPGGSGNRGSNEYGQQYYDPITGQPLSGSPTQGYSGNQGYSGGQGYPGMQYQGFGVFEQGRRSAPYPGMIGGPPQGPPPRRRWRGPLIAATAVTAAVLVAIVATVVLARGSGSDDQAAQLPPPTSSRAQPTSTGPTSTGPTSTGPTSTAPPAKPAPVIAGWQSVPVPKRTAAYDVPPDWLLETPDNIVGFGPPEDPITMTGVAVYRKGFCPGQSSSYRATTGATARRGPNDAAVATETAQKLADIAYSANGRRPQVALGPPEPIALDQGRITGTRVAGTVVHPAPGPCDSPTIAISVVATNSDGNGSVVHIGVADQGVPDALPADTLTTIASSFRPD